MAKAIFISILLLIPTLSFSQQKYGFNFASKWTWEDLISHTIDREPNSILEIEQLRKQMSNEDARNLMMYLAMLSSLTDLRELEAIPNQENELKRDQWVKRIQGKLAEKHFEDSITGMLKAAAYLNTIRIPVDFGASLFKNKSYIQQPNSTARQDIEMQFDYDAANAVIELMMHNTYNTEQILEYPSYKRLLQNNFLSRLNTNAYLQAFETSKNQQPIINIYKWVNPSSFIGFGGVYLNADRFAKVLTTLKENEENIKQVVRSKLDNYLPANTPVKCYVNFMFGSNTSTWSYGNEIGINLEYSGDDYDYIINSIVHEVLYHAQVENQVHLYELSAGLKDNDFISLMREVMLHGTANYIGPLGTDTRPASLLEKDFQIFNKTYGAMFKNNNAALLDSLIMTGQSYPFPYYTMGTQMAYILETTIGKQALLDAMSLGPVHFFSQYINTYRESSNIRKVFKFSKDVEAKVEKLYSLVPEKLNKKVVELKRNAAGNSALDQDVNSLISQFDNTPFRYLTYFAAGDLFLTRRETSKAREFYLKGIQDSKDKGKNASVIADHLFENGANTEALELYNIAVENSPSTAVFYEKRGLFFYRTGDLSAAKLDFEKAVSIDANSKSALALLSRIN